MFNDLFHKYYNLAINTYHVNPIIFLTIYVISIPIFYVSFFLVIKEFVLIKNNYGEEKFKITAEKKKLIFLLSVLVIDYLAPYVYVLIWGENLPVIFWIILLLIIVVRVIFEINKIKNDIKSNSPIRGKLIWDLYAYCYDSLLKLKPYKNLIEIMLKESSLKSGQKVLDIGSGTGNYELLNTVCGVKFTCLDFSDNMMKISKKKNPGHNYLKYDINTYSIPVKNTLFDKAVSTNVIYNVDNLEIFFADVKRVLVKNGLFIFTTSTSEGLFPIIKEHFREGNLKDHLYLLSVLPKLLVVTIINVIIDKSSSFKFYSEEELEAEAKKAGFSLVRKKRVFGGLNTLMVLINH